MSLNLAFYVLWSTNQREENGWLRKIYAVSAESRSRTVLGDHIVYSFKLESKMKKVPERFTFLCISIS